jgi:aminomethyltransferase
VSGIDALVARTGYTGEDGFELFVPWDAAPALWDELFAAGRGEGLVPVGLGARDTLRLEAGMPLYGNELDRTVRPYEAGLGRVVRLDKPGDFVGRAALEAFGARPLTRTLVGLELRERGVPRHGYPVFAPAAAPAPTGVVTSGTISPTLGRAIAMAYVPPDAAALGTMQAVSIRDGHVAAEVVALPFYARPR